LKPPRQLAALDYQSATLVKNKCPWLRVAGEMCRMTSYKGLTDRRARTGRQNPDDNVLRNRDRPKRKTFFGQALMVVVTYSISLITETTL
jgi:hypothetical protein